MTKSIDKCRKISYNLFDSLYADDRIAQYAHSVDDNHLLCCVRADDYRLWLFADRDAFGNLAFRLKTAAPLIALTGLTLYTINMIRNRQAIDSGEALRLGIAAIFGVPVGVWGLSNLNELMIKLVLGIILIGFATARSTCAGR